MNWEKLKRIHDDHNVCYETIIHAHLKYRDKNEDY